VVAFGEAVVGDGNHGETVIHGFVDDFLFAYGDARRYEDGATSCLFKAALPLLGWWALIRAGEGLLSYHQFLGVAAAGSADDIDSTVVDWGHDGLVGLDGEGGNELSAGIDDLYIDILTE